MEEHDRAKYEAQSRDLRADLKTWETTWAKTHDGKKPGRDDIKQNAEIGTHIFSHLAMSERPC